MKLERPVMSYQTLISSLLLCLYITSLRWVCHVNAYSTSNNSRKPRIINLKVPTPIVGQQQEHDVHTSKVLSHCNQQNNHIEPQSPLDSLRQQPKHQQSTTISPRITPTGNGSINENNNIPNLSSTTDTSNSWLDQATVDILDTARIPYTRLTNDDVETISGLMAQWARRKTTHSAIQVETLLKRVVDDHNAGNASVKVSTRMYTMAIDAWAKTGGKQAAQRASDIHRGMVDAYRSTGDVSIRPSTISYNAVINAWSKSGCDAEAAIRAEGILEEMLEEWRRERELLSASSSEVDDAVLNSKNRDQNDGNGEMSCIHSKEDPDEVPEDDSIVKPDVVSFTSVIDTWAKSGHKDGAAKAMVLLKQMEELYVGESQRGMKPNVYTYSACINAFAKSSDLNAPKQAEALLADMKKAFEAGDMDVKPNVVNYNSVINAWGRCKKEGSAERASEILYTMEKEGAEPDALSYSLVASAWAHSLNENATRQAELALTEMEKWAMKKNKAIDEAFDNGLNDHASANGQFDKDAAPSSLPAIRVQLDVECYNTVLISLSRRREVDAPDRAISILHRMQHLADNGFEAVRPNAKSWNSVLNTLSRANDDNSTERAEQIICDMREAGTHPDVFSYAALLHAYQKNASYYGAERADDIVREMEQLHRDGILSASPDVYHYTIVCACWARSGAPIASQRCWQILQHMLNRAKEGFSNCEPNVRTYNAVIDAYARGYHVDEAENLLNEMLDRYNSGNVKVKPDGFTFNAVINAWTRSRRRGCGHRAELILKRLLEFHENGNPDVKPDSRSFSHIIDYYSRSRERDAGKKAEWLLTGMIKMYEKGYSKVFPNIFPFTAVIATYAKAQDMNAGVNAERVFNLLEEFHMKHQIRGLAPNTFVMNTVLHAWSKSAHSMPGKRAGEILSYMDAKFREGNTALDPNTRSYGLVLASWSKSLCPEKAVKAREVLDRMSEASKRSDVVAMNVHCYNAVINAAAFTEGDLSVRINAFNIASTTLEELLEYESFDAISSSFGTYLKACGKLSLPRAMVEPAIAKAFKRCQELGLVNDFVLTQVRYSTCTSQYQALLGEFVKTKKIGERLTMSEIPESWKSNVAAPFFDNNADRGEWWRDDY